jgi:hypothetical protein
VSILAISKAMARLRRSFLRRHLFKRLRLSLQASLSGSKIILRTQALKLKQKVPRSVILVMLRRIKQLSRWAGISKLRCMVMIEIKIHLRTSTGIEVCATPRISFLETMLTIFK